MDMKLNQLTDKINNHPLFNVNQETNADEYNSLLNLFTVDLYQYVNIVYKNSPAIRDGEMNLRFWKTELECLKYYNKNNGPFVNYFNAAFAKEIHYEESAIKERNNGGVHLEKKTKKAIHLITEYLKNHPNMTVKDIWDIIDKHNVSIINEVSVSELKDTLLYYTNGEPFSIDTSPPTANDNCSVADILPDKRNSDFVQELLLLDSQERIFEIIEETYQTAAKASKELISIRLTNQILASGEIEYALELTKHSFFHQETARIIQEQKTGLSNNEIAELSKKSAANASKIWSFFCRRVIEKLKEEEIIT